MVNRSLDEEGIEYAGTPSRSYLGVPIVVGDKAIGVISVQSTREEGRFGESDAGLLSTIAANVGIAIRNAQLYEETRRRGDEMAALAEVAREFSSAVDMATVLDRVAERARDLLDVETSAVYLAEPDAETFRAAVALGDNAEEIKADLIRGEGDHQQPRRAPAAEVINDTSRDRRAKTIPGTEEEAGGAAHGRSLARAGPRDRNDGRLAVRPEAPFTQADLDLLVGLSQQAAAAIEVRACSRAQSEAEMRFRRLAEELPLVTYMDAPFAADTETAPLVGRNEYISPQCEAMLGYPPTDWGDGALWEKVLHPDDRDRVLGEMRRFQETGEPLSTEYRMFHQDGRVVWVHDESVIVRDESGAALWVQGFWVDITERKELEEALRAREAEVSREKQHYQSLVALSRPRSSPWISTSG